MGLAMTWLQRHHGRPEPHQFMFYRCETCRGLVSFARITTGGCACGGIKMRPTALSFLEKVRALLLPWTV